MKEKPIKKKQKKVKQTHSTASSSSKYTRPENMVAAEKGNAPSMEELVRRAKEEDDEKSFMVLIENYTAITLADMNENSLLLHPWIDIDYEFYKQPWVQKTLKKGMLGRGRKCGLFREKFWKAVFSNTETDHLRWATQDQINMLNQKD